MKAKQTKWMILLGIIMTAITFTACGSDDDSESGGNGSGVNGYYISGNLYTNADFRNDVVWEYMRISQDAAALFGNPVPTWTLFDSNGLFFPKSSDGNWEYLRNNIEVIRVDYNCIYSYSGVDLYQLGASGTRGMELLYKFDAGEYGTLGFYGHTDVIYVYRRDGNKLIVDVGDGKNTNTFLITDGGLILSGGGSYTKYNPNTTY